MQQVIHLKNLPLKTLALAGLMALGAMPATAAIDCTLTPGSPNATFNINNVLDITADQQLAIPLSVACSKSGSGARVGYFCMRIGQGSAGTPAGASYTNRWLAKGTDYAGFQIYKDAGYSQIWGSNEPAAPATPNFRALSFNALLWDTDTFSMPLYTALKGIFPSVGGVSSIQNLAPGTYTSTFNDVYTEWQARTGAAVSTSCTGLSLDNRVSAFSFTATANIAAQCKITVPPNDIDFGTQVGSATNLQGSTAVSVQCTRTTPYFIGLRPGNGNTAGAGVMNAISPVGNTDTVPYQLRQAAGMSGAIWGDTATTSSAGNGVAGTGLGSSASNYTIYATVPSANSAAGNYQDTVTMTVHY